MKIEREPLLAILKRLRPALADRSAVPALTHIWLDGVRAFAFNDVIGIEMPCSVDVGGGLSGGTIVGLLEKSSVKEINLDYDDAGIVLKFGGSRAKLPLLSLDQRVDPFPEVPADAGLPLDENVLAALAHVMISVATSGSYASAGATMMSEGDVLSFYASDGMTIAWARIQHPDIKFDIPRTALSAPFCNSLLSLCRGGGELHFFDDCLLAVGSDGTRLFCRAMEQSRELDFTGVIAANYSPDSETMPLPEEFSDVVDRILVLSASSDVAKTMIGISEGVVRFDVKSGLGELHESVNLGKPYPKAVVQGEFDAAMLQRGLSRSKYFAMSADAFTLLDKDGFGYMSSAIVT